MNIKDYYTKMTWRYSNQISGKKDSYYGLYFSILIAFFELETKLFNFTKFMATVCKICILNDSKLS